MTKLPFKSLSPTRYKQAAPQESVPTSYPRHKNAEFIRAVMAVESGESSDISPPGFPISGLLGKITAQDRTGRTTLHRLATRGHAKCLDMIMERLNTEDDAIIMDYDGRTAIHEAIIQNNKAVLDVFLKYEMARRAINRIGRNKRTDLHWAALGGRDDILQKLIDSGANLELTEEYGQTALRVAASRKNSEGKWIILLALTAKGDGNKVSEELVRRGQLRPNDKGSKEETLLHHAVKKGNEAIARTLVQIGSFNVNAMDSEGSTPLAYACEAGDEAMVKLLIDARANPNVGSQKKGAVTTLVKATLSENVAIVNRLIGAKVEVDAKDSDGYTALLLAASKGFVNIVAALLDGGANINIEGARRSSPLGKAADKGHKAVVKLLLERNAEVNAQDNAGRSPLSYAAGSGFKDCVDLLLDAGAVVGMVDWHGMTPSAWARRNEHEAIAGSLLEKEYQYNSEQLQAADDEYEMRIG